MNEWLNKAWGLLVTPEGAGAVGSLISLRWAPGESMIGKITSIAGGFAFAIYLVPLLTEYMEIKSARAPLALAFIGGLVGMNLLAKGWIFAQSIDFHELLNVLLRRKEGK